MSSIDIPKNPTVLPSQKGGSAVGVPERKWYVAIVKNCTELLNQKRLFDLGYEAYVPTQSDIRITPKGRRMPYERVVLPTLLFVHVTEKERLEVVNLPYINRYMVDKTRTDKFGKHIIPTIPDEQLDKLKFMLYKAENHVSVGSVPYQRGDMVRVVRGNMQGLVGELIHDATDTFITIRIDHLGEARVHIDWDSVELIEPRSEK